MVKLFCPDGWERKIAAILRYYDIDAIRPKSGTQYSDVLIEMDGKKSWLEIKMNHDDNLSNPRVFYDGNIWNTTYSTNVAKVAIELLNSSSITKEFLKSIAKYSKIKNPKIPTTKLGLKDSRAVPLKVMKDYFDQPYVNRYILVVDNYDIGKLVTDHYLTGKAEPVYYIQAGDDFYRFGDSNPLNLPEDIPKFKGTGSFKVRISTRSKFYEVQAEIKIDNIDSSPYSILVDDSKKNPFERFRK